MCISSCLFRKWHVNRRISQRCVCRHRWAARLRLLLHGVLQVRPKQQSTTGSRQTDYCTAIIPMWALTCRGLSEAIFKKNSLSQSCPCEKTPWFSPTCCLCEWRHHSWPSRRALSTRAAQRATMNRGRNGGCVLSCCLIANRFNYREIRDIER